MPVHASRTLPSPPPAPAAEPGLDDGLPSDEARWAAFARGDAGADGRFVAAVRTTGVYCRPSCPAKRAKRENVGFYATPAAAEAAGYRACLRCRPDEAPRAAREAEAVARACRLIEAAEEAPGLAELAGAAGLSPSHFHRVFRRVTGLTPKAYAAAHRAGRLASSLPGARTVAQAAYEAGYGAPSRFYAQAPARLGMSPSAYRRGGPGERVRYAVVPCVLGQVLVAATTRGVCAIQLGEDADALVLGLRARFPQAQVEQADPMGGDGAGFADLVALVVRLVERPGEPSALPLDIRGTAFQQRVWQALQTIPPGTTASYAEIARAIGAPGAVRAVARACGANEIAVAIPCHRVVRSDGALSGYRWGVARKRGLLAREAGTGEDDEGGAR